jgi:hypothetical protein
MEDLFTRNESDRSPYGAKRGLPSSIRTLQSLSSRYFDRLQRFETEKELVKEVTIRKKDEEANRFTRRGKEWNLGCNGSPRSFARIDGSVKR